MNAEERFCSFCGKPESAVKVLVAGGGDQPARSLPRVNICDECIDLCAEIRAKKTSPASNETTNDDASPYIVPWTAFVVEGLALEWAAYDAKQAGVVVTVRNKGASHGGSAQVYPVGHEPTEGNAIACAMVYLPKLRGDSKEP